MIHPTKRICLWEERTKERDTRFPGIREVAGKKNKGIFSERSLFLGRSFVETKNRKGRVFS